MITEFGLLRHAETTWNISKTIQGQTDTELSENGILSAQKWGQLLAGKGWQRILCSTLTRAVHTASLINKTLQLPVETDIRLIEQDWGTWAGRSIAQLRIEEDGEVERQEARGWDFTPGGGESRKQVRNRILTALQEAAFRWPSEKILVVGHLAGIKCIMNHIAGVTTGPDIAISKRAMHRIAFNKNFSIVQSNIPL